jgi:ATP-dependent helicase HrpB
MAAMPLHPRLARVLLESEARQVAQAATRIAALMSSGQKARQVDLIHAADGGLAGPAERTARQLERQVHSKRDRRDWEKALAECLLAGYPDRVAKRRRGDEYEIAGGISAKLASPLPKEAEWIVAVDVEERSDKGLATIRAAAPIEADWLLDLFPDSVESVERYSWNRQSERVEEESALVFHGLTLESSVDPRPKTAGASAFLAQRAREAGWRRFLDVEETELLLARASFAMEHGWTGTLDEAKLLDLLVSMCESRSGFDQIRDAVSNGEWQYRLSQALDFQSLEAIAPERVKLPGGRSVRVNYVSNQTPYIESRLQDFWGMSETPKLARGAVPVLVHLLAPNKRPVQMTQDLGSFWTKLYPELRTQLSRRYPKHQWP